MPRLVIPLVLMLASCEPLGIAPGTPQASTLRVADAPTTTLTGAAGAGIGGCFAAAGDVNGDRIDDVLIGGASQVALHHGALGGLVETPAQTWSTGGCPLVADVDGDGLDDLLILSEGDVVQLYLATTAGWPAMRTSRLSGFFDTSTATARAIGDLDGDGDDEVQDASGAVWLGGSGGLSATRPGPRDGAFGDFTGNGFIDRVAIVDGPPCTSGTASQARQDLVLFRGSSTGLDSSSRVVRAGDCTVVARDRIEIEVWHTVDAVGDIDGDGDEDLFVQASTDAVFDEGSGCCTVTQGAATGVVLSGSAGVPFLDETTVSLLGGPALGTARATTLRDTDCDGSDDILLQGTEAFPLCWILDGDAADLVAAEPQRLQPVAGTGGSCLGAGDLDSDGATDLIWGDPTAGDGAGEVRINPGVGVGCPVDRDGDGFLSDVDCDDGDASIRPDAEEGVDDGVDQNCDGIELCFTDVDADGFRSESTTTSRDPDCEDLGEAGRDTPSGDCDDRNPEIYPGAEEFVADGVDQDCDGTEICYADADRDGWRAADTIISSDPDCDDAGEANGTVPPGDCNDEDAAISPAQLEEPGDGVDQNCDGEEVCFEDADDDGWRTNRARPSDDPDCDDSGEALASDPEGDCDDQDATINPGAEDTPEDGIDQDCDGSDAESTGSCSTLGGASVGWLAALGLLALRRRRR